MIYTILYYSALRAGELLNSKRKHLIKNYSVEDKRSEYFLLLEDQKNNEKNEYTPLRMQDYTALIDYCNTENIKSEEFIFSNRKDSKGKRIPISVSGLNRHLKRLCKKLQIETHYSSHSFRAGRVTELRKKGYDYGSIAIITRHQNIKMLIRHYDKKIKSRAYEIVENN